MQPVIIRAAAGWMSDTLAGAVSRLDICYVQLGRGFFLLATLALRANEACCTHPSANRGASVCG